MEQGGLAEDIVTVLEGEHRLRAAWLAGSRARLASPPIAATRESAIGAHLACARLFLPYARELCERTGDSWPAGLETAARSSWPTTLSLTLQGRRS